MAVLGTFGSHRRRAVVGNDRSSWGREVHRTRDGKHSTFVRDFGDRNLVVTEVTWA